MSSSTEWKAIAAAVKTLVEEATFEADTEGLTFRAMDPSHVALVDLTLPNSSWQTYQCGKPWKFSVRVEDLVKLIARGDSKDSLEIKDTEEDAVSFTFQNGYKREFTIHLIESTAASAPLPKLEFETNVTLTKAILDKILGDMTVVADQVTIEATKEKIVFRGKSDVGKADVALAKNDADVLKFESSAESKATFSIDYIQSLLKALSGVADTVDLSYSTKKPMKLSFALNSQGARLLFWLAPRVSE